MGYNLTWLDSANTIQDIAVNVSASSNGWLGTTLLFVIFVVVFMVFRNQETKKVLLVDGFFTTVLGILFWAAGMIPVTHLMTIFFIFLISVMMMFGFRE